MAVSLKRDIMLIPVDRTAAVPIPTLSWLLGIAVLTLLASLQPISAWLSYDQSWFEQGHYWRPLTASIAQLHLKHWLMNQWGLVIMALLLPARLARVDTAALLFVWLTLTASLPLMGYSDYAGLSGVIYGWLIWSLLTSPHYPSWLLLTVASGVSLKVMLENFTSMSHLLNASTADFLEADIAVRAHLVGLSSGWLIGLYYGYRHKARRAMSSKA
ncbi:MAG: rhomboid family intramembrane serine protease [Saccharospirillum sp.]|nr:rhomboid family intramembrane serine protease [Saccharospirillum sp.]